MSVLVTRVVSSMLWFLPGLPCAGRNDQKLTGQRTARHRLATSSRGMGLTSVLTSVCGRPENGGVVVVKHDAARPRWRQTHD